ncbi:beta-1,3-galactosyltransferase 1 [Octopus bimaculoides]|uniref:Hexosyltransferase n=1 Tax=Octopus bimaculoides TaxID=37653 RepID=A0A0L8FU52_OCTBM|nr:beta-1,3-galactosyltransferase 1 [Octopus bimaculoides]|eukprot:XP_014786875.1 PREDICTED: beta-1,3-galactosyltransferase 1-like [Octopus bimaculoides]
MALDRKSRYFLIFVAPLLTYITLSVYLKKLHQKQQTLNLSSQKQFKYAPTLSKRNEVIDKRRGSQPVIDVIKQVMVDEIPRDFRRENNDVRDQNMLELSQKFTESEIKNEDVLERNQMEEKNMNLLYEDKEEHIFKEKFIEKPIADRELKLESQKKRNGKSYQMKNNPIFMIREPDMSWCQKFRARILILIFSRPENIYERQIIRKTWLKDLPKEMYVIFVIGKSEFDKDTLESEEEFQDILQGEFKDHKRSETTKFMMTLFWFSHLQNYCKVPKLVLKTVDNIYINVAAFHEWLRTKYTTTKNVYLGRVVKNDQPNRDRANPRYVPKIAFHHYIFPDYLNGPQYLFSADVIQRMSYVSKLVFPIAVEDAYIGLLSDRLQIKPIQDENFHLLMKTTNVCINAKLLFIFCKSAKEMNKLHRQIINSKKSFECQPPRSQKHLGL